MIKIFRPPSEDVYRQDCRDFAGFWTWHTYVLGTEMECLVFTTFLKTFIID